MHELPDVLLADAGYWHGESMQRITDRGIQVLIPPDTSRRERRALQIIRERPDITLADLRSA